MKYSTIIFDFGDTLTKVDENKTPRIYPWVSDMIQKLYQKCYRLAILSNTYRHQDGWWIRSELAKFRISQYFEAVVSSAQYGVHKPDLSLFKKVTDFMQVSPKKTIMVGDSLRCDGVSSELGMTFFKVEKDENWSDRFFKFLDDNVKRKLTNIYEYNQIAMDKFMIKTGSFSEVVQIGDVIVIGENTYKVKSIPIFTNQEIFTSKDVMEVTVDQIN